MFVQSRKVDNAISVSVDSTAVLIFVDILVELTNKNTVFVNSTNITTNETPSLFQPLHGTWYILTNILIRKKKIYHNITKLH